MTNRVNLRQAGRRETRREPLPDPKHKPPDEGHSSPGAKGRREVVEIREQIAALIRTSYRTDSWHLERASDILALPELPENLQRLKLYPKLVEALDYMMGTGYDSTKLTSAEEVLAEAKKLEEK